jgi:hypothetical protein
MNWIHVASQTSSASEQAPGFSDINLVVDAHAISARVGQ